MADSEHEFDDREYVRQWAESADRRRPERARMFEHVVGAIRALGRRAPHVVELGCGPGTLGDKVLDALPAATYEGLDLSRPMLELARERLARYDGRARLVECDLRAAEWTAHLARHADAVISNQALHDLGSAEAVDAAYRGAFACLAPGGLVVNAELVVPPGGSANKPAKLPVARHLALLRDAGFEDVRADLEFGEYVALVARRPA